MGRSGDWAAPLGLWIVTADYPGRCPGLLWDWAHGLLTLISDLFADGGIVGGELWATRSWMGRSRPGLSVFSTNGANHPAQGNGN